MRVRLLAVRLVWEGYPATAVSDILGITGETVRSDVASGNQGGPGALIPGKSPGKPPKIPPEIVEQLCPRLQESLQTAGYGESANGDTWVSSIFARSLRHSHESSGMHPMASPPWFSQDSSPVCLRQSRSHPATSLRRRLRSSAKLDCDNYDNIMMKIGARPTQNGGYGKR